MSDLGTIALMIALAACLYGTVVPHLGVRTNNWNLIRSAQNASIISFFLIAIASGVLIHALVVSDFSIFYVWRNSSVDMPMFFKVTAFWGGLEGSLLFWILVQSFFAMIVAFRYQYSNREIIPYVIATLNGILCFLLVLLLGWSNPLDLQATIPAEGQGLNPLLQHIAMVVHPPSLYLGFIGFSVPFAFAIAGMIRGKSSDLRWTAAPLSGADRHGDEGLVSAEERETRFGQKPVTVLLTGLAGSGKTRIAAMLERALFDLGRVAIRFDGTTMRQGLNRDLGFSAEDRSENLRRSMETAKLVNDEGIICVAAFVAPRATTREKAATLVGPDRFLTVHCAAPLEYCQRKDPTGLYADAEARSLDGIPGISFEYETPENPDLSLPSHQLDLEESVNRILALMNERGFLR